MLLFAFTLPKPPTTLRASLSGTFLQTLPDLVTPLKGTLYLRAAVHRRGQCPPKGSGTNNYDCRSNLVLKHARKHETHPPWVIKKVPSRFKRFWFYLNWHKQHGNIKQTSVIIWVACNKRTTVWTPIKHWQFSGPYGVTKYGSGWRKEVVNQFWEFDLLSVPLAHRWRWIKPSLLVSTFAVSSSLYLFLPIHSITF